MVFANSAYHKCRRFQVLVWEVLRMICMKTIERVEASISSVKCVEQSHRANGLDVFHAQLSARFAVLQTFPKASQTQ